jgi:peptidoglycan/LPS O-acetylase OafA/YrhL
MTDLAATTPALKSASKGERESYMPQLDGLRAIAVFLVINHHYMPSAEHWNFPLRTFVDRIGPLGVRLFFVLSGFLITAILLRGRPDAGAAGVGSSLKQFYIRRFLRIFPLYYMVLAVAALINMPYVREALGWHAFYLSNVYYSTQAIWGDGPCSHFWSLAVEEQFYLAWPLLVLIVPRRFVLAAIVTAMFSGTAFRLVGCLAGFDLVGIIYLPFGSLDTLGAGALLAYAASPEFGSPKFRQNLERLGYIAGIPIGVAALAMTYGTHDYTWGIAFFDTGMALFFVAVISHAARGIRGPIGFVLGRGPLPYIGRISYGVYIYHLFAIYLFMQVNFSWLPGYERAAIYGVSLAATIAVASVSFYLFERPINNLKRLFPYTRRNNAARPASAPPESLKAEAACAGVNS